MSDDHEVRLREAVGALRDENERLRGENALLRVLLAASRDFLDAYTPDDADEAIERMKKAVARLPDATA